MKALIIDDSRAMRTLMRALCQNLEFETVEAANGQEGLDQARANLPLDVIMLDWDMPIMSGLELLKELRSDEAFEDVKIMMVTSRQEMEDIVSALEDGADDYIMKPLTEEMFEDKMRLLGLVE